MKKYSLKIFILVGAAIIFCILLGFVFFFVQREGKRNRSRQSRKPPRKSRQPSQQDLPDQQQYQQQYQQDRENKLIYNLKNYPMDTMNDLIKKCPEKINSMTEEEKKYFTYDIKYLCPDVNDDDILNLNIQDTYQNCNTDRIETGIRNTDESSLTYLIRRFCPNALQ